MVPASETLEMLVPCSLWGPHTPAISRKADSRARIDGQVLPLRLRRGVPYN